jgi:hypothetical protein
MTPTTTTTTTTIAAHAIAQLRADARQWWWHAELRQRGQHAEARRLENASTRRLIQSIRTMRIAHKGDVGWHYDAQPQIEPGLCVACRQAARYCQCAAFISDGTPFCSSRSSTSGCRGDIGALLDLWAPDVPYVDKSALPQDVLVTLVYSGPMLGDHEIDEPEGGGMSYVSTGSYIAIAEAFGARVSWGRLAADADMYRQRPRVQEHVARLRALLAE